MNDPYGVEETSDLIEGAVIDHLMATKDGVLTLVLDDGRNLVLVNCVAVAVCQSKHFLQ